MSAIKKIVIVGILLGSVGLGAELVSRTEFEKVNQGNQQEFKNISISLAEIKNELTHLNQDMAELKELRRSMLDRMIDIALAGGLAFSGGLAWRNRKNGKIKEA
jgi:hypothetical protein